MQIDLKVLREKALAELHSVARVVTGQSSEFQSGIHKAQAALKYVFEANGALKPNALLVLRAVAQLEARGLATKQSAIRFEAQSIKKEEGKKPKFSRSQVTDCIPGLRLRGYLAGTKGGSSELTSKGKGVIEAWTSESEAHLE